MEDILRKIEENTAPKDSFQITISNNKTDFITRFNPPLQLKKGKQYEMALLNLETYYSFPNIDSTNNNFKYSPDGGGNWFTVTVPKGSYEIRDIDAAIKQQMKTNGHYDSQNDKYYVSIAANSSTLKTILTLDNNYQVDFTLNNSLRHLFGFNSTIYTESYQESEGVVNIVNINSILVNIDIITGSYVNGRMQPVIYSFFPKVSPGYKIVEKPPHLKYLPVTLDTIANLRTYITCQDGNLLNLRGEVVTIRLDIREK